MSELKPCPFCGEDSVFIGVHDDEGNYHGRLGCKYESHPWSGLSYALHHEGWGRCILCTDGANEVMGGILFDTAEEAAAAFESRAQPVNLVKECPAMERVEGGIPYCSDKQATCDGCKSSNEPLTLEQLRKMNGSPVWWWNKSHAPVCTICIVRFGEVSFADFDYSHEDSTGIVQYKRWIKWGFKPYHRKPEGSTKK